MFYKILPKDMAAYGYCYHLGVNKMENPDDLGKTLLSAEGEGYEAGLYFADDDNILAYCHYGEYIATVEIADNATLEYWGDGEYSTDALEIFDIRPLWDINTLYELEKEGVNFSADNDSILFWAKEYQKWDIVTYLEKNILKDADELDKSSVLSEPESEKGPLNSEATRLTAGTVEDIEASRRIDEFNRRLFRSLDSNIAEVKEKQVKTLGKEVKQHDKGLSL